MRRALFALVLATAIVVPAFAQDAKYELKLKKEAQGDRVSVKSDETSDIHVLIDLMGQEVKNDEKSKEKKAYIEEILVHPAGAKKSTKLSRTYTAAEKTKGGTTKKQVYAGKTVVIEKKGEKKGEKYKFSIDGEEIAEDDAEELEKEFNKKEEFPLENEDLLPGKPVKLGESWTVDSAKIVKSFEEDGPFVLDVQATKVTGKLLKVYAKDGKQYGTIELSLHLAVKELKLDGNPSKMKDGSKISGTMVLDICIDGTSNSGTEKSTLKFDLSGEIPNGKIAITGDVVSAKSGDEAPKK